jgi:hypothetical protein
MDTLIIGNQRFTVDDKTVNIIEQALDFLNQVRTIIPFIETEQNYHEMNNLIEDVEDLVNHLETL